MAGRRDAEGSTVKAIGWDLDSTLCNTMHRRYLIEKIHAGEATWDDYSDLAGDDEPIAGAVQLAQMMHSARYWQVAISGRSSRAMEITVGWLAFYGVPMDHVVLRPEGDRTENGLWKVQQIRRLQERGAEFELFVEDWGPAAKFIEAETGIPVLGVNPFDPAPQTGAY